MAYGIGGDTTKYNTHVAGTGGYCGITFETEQNDKDYADKKRVGKIFMPKKCKTKQYTQTNATIVGSLTAKDNVYSGFSSANYLKVLDSFDVSGGKTFEMVFKIKTGSDISTIQSICGNTSSSVYDPVSLEVDSSHFNLNLCNTNTTNLKQGITGTYIVLANTDYYVKVTYDGSVYTLSYSLDGKTFIQEATYSSTTSVWTSNLALGRQQGKDSEYPFLGSIDLKGCYININGERVWNGVTNYTKEENVYLAIKE